MGKGAVDCHPECQGKLSLLTPSPSCFLPQEDADIMFLKLHRGVGVKRPFAPRKTDCEKRNSFHLSELQGRYVLGAESPLLQERGMFSEAAFCHAL